MFAARNNPTKNRSSDFLPGVCVWSSVVCRFKKGSYYTDNVLFECTVDKWRVVLKGENPDYINASSIHVSHLSVCVCI